MRHFGIALVGLVAALAATPARAQEWSNYAGGVWSLGTNWNPAGVPTFGTSTALTFGFSPPNLPPTFPYSGVGNYTATADGATVYQVNRFIFNAFGANDVTSNGVVITNNNLTGGISFVGTNPQITQNGTSSIAFANGTATNDILLNSTSGGVTINGSGFGHVNINGVVSGTGNITVDHLGTSPLYTGGQIFIAPGAANTFSGNIVLNNGNLTLNTTNALQAAGNQIIINGGTIRGSTAFTLPATTTVVLNSQLIQTGVLSGTYNSPINGNGGIRIASFNSGTSPTTTFNNTISGTGAINVEGIGVSLPVMVLGSGTTSQHGTALDAASYTASLATIQVTNATANVSRLNPAASLTLNNGTFTFTGGGTGANVETVASTNLGGNAQITLSPTATTSMTLNAGTLNRSGKATLSVTTQGTGLTLGGTPATNGNANLFFTAATASDNVGGVLPYGIASVTVGGLAANTLVRYDTTNGVVPLNLATDYNTSHPISMGNNPTSNQQVNAAYGGAFTGNRTVNSLFINTTSGAAAAATVGSSGTNATITLTSGAFGSGISGGTAAAGVPVIFKPNLAMPAGVTGYLHGIGNTVVILGSITGDSGFVKTGGNLTALYGNNSNLTGGLQINHGNLAFTRDVNLGAAGGTITLNAGQGGGFLSFNSIKDFAPITSNTLTINRPTVLENAGGGGFVASHLNNTLEWNGNISGNGRLYKLGAGQLILAGTNVFTGDIGIFGGYLTVNSDSSLGNSANAVIFNNNAALGVYTPGPLNTTTNRNFLITGSTAGANGINTPNDYTINCQIVGAQTGVTLFKLGDGNLTLTGANTINGPVTIGFTAPTRLLANAFAQTGGTVTLSGPNGALAGGTSYSVNWGTLHLDNSGSINSNRLASKGVTYNGGEFKLTGNASANTAEHIGVSSTAGFTSNTLGNTITVSQPAGVGGNRNTTLVATAYSEGTATAITFFRGTNLGGTSGDTTNIRFVAAPTLTNGIIRSGLYADSATGVPQDFATHTTANGIERFTAYVSLPSTGATNTFVYSASAPTTFIAAQSVNALKITDTSIDLAGNTFSITGAGALLVTGTLPSSITTSTGTPDLAFGTAPARITVNTTLTVGSVANPVRITGSAGLNKFGTGTLEVSSTTITTPVSIAQGTYRTLTTAAVPTGSVYTVSPGATLDFNNLGTVATPLGTMTLNGFGSVAIGSGAIALGATSGTFGGSITGNGTLMVTGAGTHTLNGNSPNFTGDVLVLAGVLAIDANVDPSKPLTAGPLGSGTTAVQLGNTTGATAAELRILQNVDTFNRDIVVPAGVPNSTTYQLRTVNGAIGAIGGNVSLSRDIRLDNTTFSSTATGYYTFTGVIQDGTAPGSIDWFGGNWNLHGNNSYTGGTFLQAASTLILGLGHDNALGTGPIVVANQTFTGTLRADNGNRTIANAFDYETGTTSNTIGFTGDNDLTFTAATVSLLNGASATTRTWNVYGTGKVTFTGNLVQSGGGNATLTKTGGGLLVLGGANTFAGGLNVNAGTVRITNTTGSGTGTGAVAISTGGRLEGTGITTSNVTVNATATLAGGSDNVGTLTLGGNLTFVAGSFMNVGITSTGANAAINTGGSTIGTLPNPSNNNFLNKTGGADPTTLNLPTLLVDMQNLFFVGDYSYAVGGGMGDQSALNVTAASQFQFYNLHPSIVSGSLFITSASFTGNAGGTIFLNFSVIPEPAFLGLAIFGIAAFLRRK